MLAGFYFGNWKINTMGSEYYIHLILALNFALINYAYLQSSYHSSFNENDPPHTHTHTNPKTKTLALDLQILFKLTAHSLNIGIL